jgi:hypothetical protein
MVVLAASPDNREGDQILSPGNKGTCSEHCRVISAFISLEPLLGGAGLGVGADLNVDSSEITHCGGFSFDPGPNQLYSFI